VTDTAGLTSSTAKQVVVGAQGNLVANSTFESSLAGWTSLVGCDISRAPAGRNEGWAASLLNSSSTVQSCTLNDSPNSVTKTVAGTYAASAWVDSDTPGLQVKLRLREYVGTTLVGTGTATATTTGGWQQVQLSYPVTSTGSTLDLNVYQVNQPAGTSLLVDDVTASTG
jgi:hypothetical protein